MTIEYADLRGDYAASTIRNAPPEVRAKLNAYRARRGLPVVEAPQPEADEPKVWRRCADGTYLEAKEWLRRNGKQSGPPSGSRREAGRAAPPAKRYGTRVLIVACHGEARAEHIGEGLPEEVRGEAFDVDTMNQYGGWHLEDGHGGPKIAEAGESLRAHVVGGELILEWWPDMANRRHAAIVERIERGVNGASITFKTAKRSLMPRVNPAPNEPRYAWHATDARLTSLALLPKGDLPAYTGAHARAWRSAKIGDSAELREQMAQMVKRAQSRVRVARGWSAD